MHNEKVVIDVYFVDRPRHVVPYRKKKETDIDFRMKQVNKKPKINSSLKTRSRLLKIARLFVERSKF